MSSRNRLIVIAMAAVCVALSIGCGSSAPATKASPTVAVDPDTLALQTAMRKMATVKNLRADIQAQTLSATGVAGMTMFTYEFLPPDRYQLISATGGITRVVGKDTFAGGPNAWIIESDFSGGDYQGVNRLFEAKFIEQGAEQLGKTATVTKAGSETVDGKTCQTYVVTDMALGGKNDICVGSDGYPLRMIIRVGALATTLVVKGVNVSDISIERPPGF